MSVSRQLVTLEPQCGTALVLKRGEVLRVVDPQGEQVADLALFCADDLREGFSPGRTIDYNESLRLSLDSVLYSQTSSVMARVVEDTVGVHDILLAPCSAEMFARRGEPLHRSCHENLAISLRRFGVVPQAISATVNVFMDVRFEADGRLRIHAPASGPGDAFGISAERDLIAGITACSSELTNNGRCKPIAYEVVTRR